MLRDLVGAAVGAASDMALVGSTNAEEPVAASVERTDADVLIVGVPDGLGTSALEALLYDRPRLTLLTIGANGRATALHELRPHTVALGDVSPSELLEAIRASRHSRAH
jgi:DNA-binding NarL/FixJ family response regulator